jgi:GntR family transcriptional regulator
MSDNWNDQQPIYKQLRDRVAAMVMDGSFVEGDAIPSVRKVSADMNINHLTVAKAYQQLVEEGVLEMKRGKGMFVVAGARKTLQAQERIKFRSDEIPTLLARLSHLDISVDEFIQLILKRK